MKTSKVTAKHINGSAFDIKVGTFNIITDGPKPAEGQSQGPTPKPLLLAALAGCSGIDVVSMLQKQRVEFQEFSIDIEGELTQEHPMIYQKIHMVYRFAGQKLPLAKLERAVDLSLEKYCGVAATLRLAGAEITRDVVADQA